jgi:hypothetical protein
MEKLIQDLKIGDTLVFVDDAGKPQETAVVTKKQLTHAIKYDSGCAAYDLEYCFSGGQRETVFAAARDIATVEA